jgi:hypothetical protein
MDNSAAVSIQDIEQRLGSYSHGHRSSSSSPTLREHSSSPVSQRLSCVALDMTEYSFNRSSSPYCAQIRDALGGI